MKVSQLIVYPLKSAAGQARDELVLEACGPAGDRRWVVIDGEGKAITQRDVPRLALVQASPLTGGGDDGLELRAPGRPPFSFSDLAPDRVKANVWGSEVDAAQAGPGAAEWLSAYLGVPARLAFMDEVATRTTSPVGPAPRPWPVSFADELPVLLLGQGSLDELNRRLPPADAPMPMDRFRPNIVVQGAPPFEEDLWGRVAIGEVELDLVVPCGRCNLIMVDQANATVHPRGEPLRTLAGFRRTTRADYEHDPQQVYFGWRAAPRVTGRLRVGDEVRVLTGRPAAEALPS